MPLTIAKVLDKTKKGLEKMAPLYCAATSPGGIWFGGDSPGGKGGASLLFSPDGVRFECRSAPELYQWLGLLALTDEHLIAAGQYGLATTRNGGRTWKKIKEAKCLYSLARTPDGTIWACGTDGFARSKDSGKSWKMTRMKGAGNLASLFLAAGEKDPDLWMLGPETLYRKRKKGDAFEKVAKFPGHDLRRMAQAPDGTLMVVGSKGLIARSSDGRRWTRSKKKLDVDLFGAAWCSGRFVLAGDYGTVIETKDGLSLTVRSIGSTLCAEFVQPYGDGVFITAEQQGERGGQSTGVLLWLGPRRKPATVQQAVAKPTKPALVAPPLVARRHRKPSGALSLRDFEEVTLEEALAEFRGLRGRFQSHPTEHQVRVYRGDLALEKHVRFTAADRRNSIVVVDGNLWGKQSLELRVSQDDGEALLMLVTGNLSARDLSIVDDAALLVEGELELEGVVAIGGGNLGHLNVRGKVRCRAALQFAYGQLHFRGGCSGLVLADPGSRVKGQLEMAVLGRDILLPTLIDDDNESEPDRERIQQAIVQGKPVLR